MESILLIEDDDEIRETLANLLSSRGYAVIGVTNGQEAMDRIEATMPCLIILDLMMPVMNGWQFRARQLADPNLATIPTVILSGASDVQKQAIALKAVDYLAKPIDLKRLYSVVGQHC